MKSRSDVHSWFGCFTSLVIYSWLPIASSLFSSSMFWQCWYSEIKPFMVFSASINSASSIPSFLYKCKKAFFRKIAIKEFKIITTFSQDSDNSLIKWNKFTAHHIWSIQKKITSESFRDSDKHFFDSGSITKKGTTDTTDCGFTSRHLTEI